MATKYNTGNPIGSADPRDLNDNSINIDEWANSQSKNSHPDRLGVQRRTWHGMESYFDAALDSYQAQVNDLVIAGGQIFPDEPTGRAAVSDGQYFYAESDDPDVSKVLWRRIDADNSELIAEDPSAEFVEGVAATSNTAIDYANMAVQIARDAGHKLAYPNVDYALNYPVEMTVDYDFNLITAVNADGGVTSVQRHADSVVQYPNTTFLDNQMSATVDRSGGVIESKTLRQAFGQYAAYPYRSFQDNHHLVAVDKNNNILSSAGRSVEAGIGSGPLYVELDSDNCDLHLVWQHGKGKMLRVRYMPNGFNELFNWRSTEIADIGDPSGASWTTVQSSNSDAWPPMVVEAVNDGDGEGSIYTGGNHGSDGGSGGEQTARMVDISFWIDSRRVEPGEVYSGGASYVEVEWVNELMAFNTISLERYVLEQHMRARFSPGDVSGFVSVTAYEPISIRTDNGPQFFSEGYDTFHYYDGEQQAALPIPTSGKNTSGVFRTYPAWATVFGSPTNGFHGVWMDRDFEAGDGRYIGGSAGAFRKGGSTKFYSNVVGGGGRRAELAEGESYEWHGGYFWSPHDAVSDDVDSAFTFHRRGVPYLGHALTEPGIGRVRLPEWATGREILGVGVAGVKGLNVSSNGYSTSFNEIKR